MSEEVLQRVEQLRKENLRLRAQCADKDFKSGQLEKQLRRLERKIAAFDAPARGLAKGFLKSDTKDVAEANSGSAKPPPRPKLNAASRTGYPSGIIIDGVTGEEVDPKSWQEPEALSANGLPALRLMHAMRSPPELNVEFDTERYAKLLGEGKQAEAEALIQAEGGPTLKQMQQEPLEVLRQCPELDVNWSDPAMHGCSLLQYACSMGYEDVTQELLRRRADASHQSHQGVSCLATGDIEPEMSPPLGEVLPRPASGGAVGSAAKPAMEARKIGTPEAANRPGLDRSDGTAPMGVAGSRALLSGRSVLGNEAERRYVEAIQSLKEGIEKEQYTVRMLQAARATAYSHKSEMEEFFLKCIDEARRELMRKKHITVNWQKSDREKVLEAMLNNEDILVCLYEKLFPHRTGIARSLGATNEGAQTMDF